jgi:hypothetical protein
MCHLRIQAFLSKNTQGIPVNKLANGAGWTEPPAFWNRDWWYGNTGGSAINDFAGGTLLTQDSCTRGWLVDWHARLSIT